MCLLCDDEKAYRLYMTYLDAMRRHGQDPDPDKAMDAVLDAIEAADRQPRRDGPAQDPAQDPANDKTLSPFFCSPVDK